MNIVERAKNLIISPKSEWETISTEETSLQELYFSYALILALIPAISNFIGRSLIGYSFLGVTIRTPLVKGLIGAIVYLVLALVGVFVLAYIIDLLAPSFGGEKEIMSSHKLAVYSATPGWIGGIFGIIPALWVIGLLFFLYGIYVLYLGANPVKKVPKEKTIVFTLVVIIVAIVIYVITTAIVRNIMVASRTVKMGF